MPAFPEPDRERVEARRKDDPGLGPTPAPPAAGAAVVDPTPCIECGYDLRGLSTEGVCPECGAAVRPSIPPVYLRDTPPPYLSNLAMATQGLICAAWLFIGAMVLTVGAIIAAASARRGAVVAITAGFAACIGEIMWTYCWLVVLQPGPRVLRLGGRTLFGVGASVLGAAVPIGVVCLLFAPGGVGVLIALLGVTAAIASIPVLAYFGVKRIRALSGRLAAGWIAEKCGAVLGAVWVLGVLIALTALLFVSGLTLAVLSLFLIPAAVLVLLFLLLRLLRALRRSLAFELEAQRKAPRTTEELR